ncbi:MAG: hypothetical protein RIQ54_42 [Candidatus Parcubacteria bacterium]|jgi:hypothetical protein
MRIFSFFTALVVTGAFFVPVFAYDDTTTHPALTEQIIDLYNHFYPGDPLTNQQREWVIQGAIDEDLAPRWINHFYDPITGSGWTGEKSGSLSTDIVRMVSALGLSAEKPLSAVEWIESPLIQEQYQRYGGNYTWSRGMRAIAEQDEKRAYQTLGHVLHLVEDMSVPDHTRNDTHAPVGGDEGSPYEQYARRYGRGSLSIARQLIEQGVPPDTSFQTIGDALASVARYSNAYFFSKDTISDSRYESPRIIRDDGQFGYGLDENGKEFPLAMSDHINENGNKKKIYSIKNREEYYPILEAYFSRLSRRAVIVGAGVVRLFQKQKADAIVNKEYPTHIAYFDPARLVLIPNFSLFGELAQIRNSAIGVVSDFTTSVSRSFSSVSGLYDSFKSFFIQSPVAAQPAQLINLFDVSSAPVRADATPVSGAPIGTANVAARPVPVNALAPPISISSARIVAAASVPDSRAVSSPVAVLPNLMPQNSDLGFVTSAGGGGGGVLSFAPPFVDPSSITTVSTVSVASSVSSSTSSSTASTSDLGQNQSDVFDFSLTYIPADLIIRFSWGTPPGAVTDPDHFVVYEIADVSDASSSIIVATTTAHTFDYPISEIGRSYHFAITARDADDFTFHTDSRQIDIPGLFKQIFVYPDTRMGKDPERFVLEIAYADGGGLPDIFDYHSHHGLVGYHNVPVDPDMQIDAIGANFQFSKPDHLISFSIRSCQRSYETVTRPIVIFSYPEYNRCGDATHWIGKESISFSAEDNRFFWPISALNPIHIGDAISFAIYQEQWRDRYLFPRIVTDRTAYIVSDSPPSHAAPTVPTEISALFDPVHVLLRVLWSPSTDSDSLDGDIRYQIRAVPHGQSQETWRDVGSQTADVIPVPLDSSGYTVFVRAVDEFGNTSEPTSVSWDMPEGFVPYKKSLVAHGGMQQFVLSHDAEVTALQLWTADFQTDSRNPAANVCSVEIFDFDPPAGDTSSTPPTAPVIIAESDAPYPGGGESEPYQYRGDSCAGDLTFTFSNAPVLRAGHRYGWRFHLMLPVALPIYRPGHGMVSFFGTDRDTAGGLFSDTSIVNAKFTLISHGSVLFEN